MKALVTGAGSYIGFSLIEALKVRGIEIRGLAKNPARLHNLTSLGVEAVLGDIRIQESIDGIFDGVDVVFHLASTMVGKERELTRTNVEGTANVFKAASAAGVKKFVLGSSGSVYGEHGDELVTEDCGCRPLTAYGRSKLEAERFVLNSSGELEPIICRMAGVYGPRSRMLMLQTAGRTHVRLVGEGDNWMSIVHVRDAAAALVAAADFGAPGEIYNISDDMPVQLKSFYLYLAMKLGGPNAKHISEATAKRLAGIVGFFGRITGKAVVFNADFVKMVLSSLKLSNEKMKSQLRVVPMYPDYRSGLDAVINESRVEAAG